MTALKMGLRNAFFYLGHDFLLLNLSPWNEKEDTIFAAKSNARRRRNS